MGSSRRFEASTRPRGGIDRDRLEGLVEAGLSITQLTAELGFSKATIRYWLRRYGLRTQRALRSTAQRAAREEGLGVVSLWCANHGETTFVIDADGFYRCRRCRIESVGRRRRKAKAVLVAEAGGRCSVCGYSRYAGALEFHHLVPEDKRLEINCRGVALALDTLRAEARKCVLLCSNCHAEVEAGVTEVPARVSGDSLVAQLPDPG